MTDQKPPRTRRLSPPHQDLDMQNEPYMQSLLQHPGQDTSTYREERERTERKRRKNTSTASSFLRRVALSRVTCPIRPSAPPAADEAPEQPEEEGRKEGQPQGKRSLLLSFPLSLFPSAFLPPKASVVFSSLPPSLLSFGLESLIPPSERRLGLGTTSNPTCIPPRTGSYSCCARLSPFPILHYHIECSTPPLLR